jgi:[glutamine synthetase] adenylyltransferase / [glutamine synthetase]-adenylyl-L-tyrosine phosphorylase
MPRPRISVRARLAAAGLDPDEALPRLREAGLVDQDDRADADLLALMSEAAGPEDALHAVCDLAVTQPERFERVRADAAWLTRVVTLAGVSRPLGDLLAQHADALESLRTLDGIVVETVADLVAEAVREPEDADQQAAGIAAIRRRATADIAARDLTAVTDVEEVAAELAGLAEAVLTGALRAVHEQEARGDPAARIAVIGMGKLGGFELNYVSDVDVVFVHEPTEGHDEEAAGRETRQVLTRLLELLNASTTMGRAYEVDPTLRPEGRSGALSRTVTSYVAYWERWAKTWEFQALLKARPVAGDLRLGERLIEAAEPFLWPERLEASVVDEIRRMKSRIESKPEVVRHGERQVKLGPGGLRDIEFAVQLLQLVHGRADRSLRHPGTLPALTALVEGGYVAESDAREFGDAYRMLRTVEHRLQLAHERRTHTIPDDPDRQEWLARALGYRPLDDRSAREAFLRDLSRVQARVRELHAKLFYRPLLEAHATVAAEDASVVMPDQPRGLGDAAATERLVALGFKDGSAALRHVRRLTTGVSRRARTMRAVLPALLSTLQDTPDPDTGLASFRELIDAHGDSGQLVARLRDHPPAATMLARVLGTSRVAGELLVDQPRGVDWLHDEALRDQPRTREHLVRMAVGRLHWQDTTAALRRFKRHELLRVILRDLNGDTGGSGVGEELTALGEACLEGALRAELTVQAERYGVAGADELPVRIAIIGMGKLGGHELHYVSDLDVVFVHEPVDGADESEATRIALDVAANVMRSLSAITAEGTAFDVDADLRPEGRSGPLSRSLASYRAYWERWSAAWEHQALTRARPVAGDLELGKAFVAAAEGFAYPEEFGAQATSQMRRMKARIEQERIPKRVAPSRHLKLGPGGLSDVEWTVQLLQQRHGAGDRVLRVPSTMRAIDALQDESLLEHRDAAWLRDGYRFLTRLRNLLYLLRHRNVDVMPQNSDQLELLARALGFGAGGWQELDDERRRHARHVRRVCERVFYGIGPGEGGFDSDAEEFDAR